MKVEELENLCNQKFGINDIRTICEKIIDRVNAKVAKMNSDYYERVYQPTLNQMSFKSKDEGYIHIVQHEVEIKNETLNLMYSPLFSLVNEYQHDKTSLIDNLIVHYYYRHNSEDFDSEELEKELSKLFFNIGKHKEMKRTKGMAADILIRIDVDEPEYYEARYIKLLKQKISDLETGYFSQNFSLNLDDRSVALLFHFLKTERLIHKDMTIVYFFRALQRDSDNKIWLQLKGKSFTNCDIGYLWAKLANYLYPKSKDRTLKWINNNFTLITKQYREKVIDEKFYKDYINDYKEEQDSLTENQEKINLMINDIDTFLQKQEADIYGGKLD